MLAVILVFLKLPTMETLVLLLLVLGVDCYHARLTTDLMLLEFQPGMDLMYQELLTPVFLAFLTMVILPSNQLQAATTLHQINLVVAINHSQAFLIQMHLACHILLHLANPIQLLHMVLAKSTMEQRCLELKVEVMVSQIGRTISSSDWT